MTILVTGVTGLVGARLLPRLVDQGLDCRALVRGGKAVPVGATSIEGDLQQPASLRGAVERVTAIIHLAAVFRTHDEDLIWKSNLEGTRNLIAATKAYAPDARFIMASTSTVYPADGSRPGSEKDDVAPTEAYPASKVAAEAELRSSGLKWSILRFGFVYGDGDGHMEALPGYRASGLFKFHPAGRMSTVHHRDIATVVDLALTGALDGQTVNVSDDAPTTYFELFQLIGATMEPSSEPLTNPWHGHMDNTLARSIGFGPTVATVHQAVSEKLM